VSVDVSSGVSARGDFFPTLIRRRRVADRVDRDGAVLDRHPEHARQAGLGRLGRARAVPLGDRAQRSTDHARRHLAQPQLP
jgi:hypothetical protein